MQKSKAFKRLPNTHTKIEDRLAIAIRSLQYRYVTIVSLTHVLV